jgi:hypothetical protein
MRRTAPISRRTFVQAMPAAAALAPAILASGKSLPSNRVRIGLIGCGGRGRELLNVFRQFPDVDVPVISDVFESRMEQAAKILAEGDRPQKPDLVVEHERILDRRDVDAVLIATTQHWHGIPFIQAAQAGKHIYVEKPFSHTVVEGRAMVEAARRSGVIALMGVQQRGYPHYLQASNRIWEDRDPAKSIEREDNPRHWGDGKPGNEVDGPWQRLFVDCLKEGKRPPVELEQSQQTTVCCHLANIAYRTGRKLRWDGDREAIIGDEEAAPLLNRRRRKGYELPTG